MFTLKLKHNNIPYIYPIALRQFSVRMYHFISQLGNQLFPRKKNNLQTVKCKINCFQERKIIYKQWNVNKRLKLFINQHIPP